MFALFLLIICLIFMDSSLRRIELYWCDYHGIILRNISIKLNRFPVLLRLYLWLDRRSSPIYTRLFDWFFILWCCVYITSHRWQEICYWLSLYFRIFFMNLSCYTSYDDKVFRFNILLQINRTIRFKNKFQITTLLKH